MIFYSCGNKETPQVVHERKLIKNDPSEINKYTDPVKTKIIISGDKGVKFTGYIISESGFKGEKGDSAGISGTVPMEYEIKSNAMLACGIDKTGKGKLRVSIWDERNDEIVSDSSSDAPARIYINSMELNGTRALLSQTENKPKYFLEITTEGKRPVAGVIYKDWENGLTTSTTFQGLTPMSIPLPACDKVKAISSIMPNYKKFTLTLYDEKRNVLVSEESDKASMSALLTYPQSDEFKKLLKEEQQKTKEK